MLPRSGAVLSDFTFTLGDRNPSFLDSEWEIEECFINSVFFLLL